MKFNSETAREARSKAKGRGPGERARTLQELFNADKARKVYAKLESKAIGGDMRAIDLYLAYSFGKPEAKIDITTGGEPVNILSKLSREQLYQLKAMKQAIEN